MNALTHTQFTFQGFELVVLPVPQAASVAAGYLHRQRAVWAVGGLQSEVGGCQQEMQGSVLDRSQKKKRKKRKKESIHWQQSCSNV